jgi:hypothetical protein
MFFKVHKEGKIGYKRLSDADLGLLNTSHQTHIGLYDDILTFLDDQEVEQKVMFIYNQKCEVLDCYFDRIKNPDGTFRSIKIRKGNDGEITLVGVIRNIVANYEEKTVWYLVWFGLASEEIVFFLFNKNTYNFQNISQLLNLQYKDHGRIEKDDSRSKSLVTYLENLVNSSSSKIISELEVISQTSFSDRRYRTYDIERANQLFREVGRDGEERINHYLTRQKELGRIENYSWMNMRSESGLPYDFTIQYKKQNFIYVDVKSTSYKFEQPMIFSGQEVDFVANINNYQIFRVYSLSEEESYLRICKNCKTYMPKINEYVQSFYKTMQSCNVKLQSVKLAIPTVDNNMSFEDEIILT